MSSGRLGTDKELEKLARRVRRAGGSVQIAGSGHLLWELDGRRVRTGRTMHPSGIPLRVRKVERDLGL